MMRNVVLLLLALARTCLAVDNVLTDNNIKQAVRLWVNNESAALELYGPISDWNTSLVTDMNVLFATGPNFPADKFNDDISNWDTSSVTNMAGMFDEASIFNAPIGKWNVSSVTSMWGMFARARGFNQDLDAWNTANVEYFQSMFNRAFNFNGNVSTWDTSKAKSMFSMFRFATSFDQELCWTFPNTTNTTNMFCNSTGSFGSDCVSEEVIEASKCVESNVPTTSPTMMATATSWAMRRGVGYHYCVVWVTMSVLAVTLIAPTLFV